MQKKITFQLSSISLSKASILFLMLFSLSACSSSDDNSGNTNEGPSSESTTPVVPLSTALDNFKNVATDTGLTAQ